MLHNGRSGSSVLADLLDQHSGFLWDGETVKPPRWKKPGDLRSFLAWSLFLSFSELYGFETKFYHVRFHGYRMVDYISMLDGLGFDKYIVLRRRNYLRGLLSTLTARGKAKKKHIPISASPTLSKVHINVDEVRYHKVRDSLVGQFDRLNEDWQDLEGHLSGHQALWLSYEDHIFEDPLRAYRLVCEFLGLAPEPVSVRLGKTNPFPVKDMIANYDEVSDALAGTPHEWMLYD